MNKAVFSLSLLISIPLFSQTNYYQNDKGEIFDQKGFEKEKKIKLKEIQNQFGKDYDYEENLEIKSSNKDSIVYSFQLTMLPRELKQEKQRLSKFINTKFSFEKLEYLNEADKQKFDSSKPTLVNFWFTSCPPCIEEIPALNELKDKYNNQINFVAVTFNNKEQVEKFLKKYNFQLSQVVNQKKLIDSYGISGYPKSFILDKNQKIVYIEDGLPGKENEKVYRLLLSKVEDKFKKLL